MTSTSSQVREILTTNDLESLERIHFGIQRTRSHSTVQGNCTAGRIPGKAVLPVVLVREGAGRLPPLQEQANAERKP